MDGFSGFIFQSFPRRGNAWLCLWLSGVFILRESVYCSQYHSHFLFYCSQYHSHFRKSKRFQFNAAQYLTDKITWCQKKLTLAPKTFINFITRRSLMYHGRYSPRCFVHGANRVSVINWRRSGKQGWHKWPRPTTPLSAD